MPEKNRRIVRESTISAPLFDPEAFVFGRRQFAAASNMNSKIAIKVDSPEVARKVLSHYPNLAFFQVSRRYRVITPAKNYRTAGFSKSNPSNRPTKRTIKRMLDESAINAINQFGFVFDYGRAPPDAVKPETKSFTLIIWF